MSFLFKVDLQRLLPEPGNMDEPNYRRSAGRRYQAHQLRQSINPGAMH